MESETSGSQVGEEEQDLKQDICLPQPLMDMGKLLKETSSLWIMLYWFPWAILATNLMGP